MFLDRVDVCAIRMSKPLKFYYDLMSQPARALYMFLKLNQIPYEGVRIDIAKGAFSRLAALLLVKKERERESISFQIPMNGRITFRL